MFQSKLFSIPATLLIAFSLLISACGTGSNTGSGTMTVELADEPIDSADAVNVFIERVEVNRVGQPEGWTALSEPQQSYDLLKLANGQTSVIASTALEPGTYPQIRLVLSQDGHSVEVDGKTHEMFIPSGAQTGIKLNIDAEIEEDIEYVLLLDFDASRSVVKAGQNEQYPYILEPTIRATEKAITGNIEGSVDPAAAEPMVYALDDINANNPDTLASTVANTESGYFKLIGLEDGSYDVSIDPRNDSYASESVQDVSVTVEATTDVGAIQVSQN